jgi:protein phosphatase
MGATCACAWVIGNRLFTASVGDSRIYLLRGGRILQLTTDHTWVQEAIDSGVLTPDQARRHPNAHVIRRYLGSRQGVVPDLRLRLQPAAAGQSDFAAETNQGATLLPGDLVLLCSDGLTDVVSDDEILRQIRQGGRLEDGLNQLLDLANRRGGPDNITMILLRMPPGESPTTPMLGPLPTLRRRRSRLPGRVLAVVLGLALGVALFLGVSRQDWLAWLSGGAPPASNPTISAPAAATAAPGRPALSSPTPAVEQTRPATSRTPAPTAALSATPLRPAAGGPTLTPWPTNISTSAP